MGGGGRFLRCTVLSVSLLLLKSITFSKEGRGRKVGGNSFGGEWPTNAPSWHRPWLHGSDQHHTVYTIRYQNKVSLLIFFLKI